MMARSPTSSNQSPDTLMQDRSPPTRRKPLATHGRTIHSGQTATWPVGGPMSVKEPEPDPRSPNWLAAYVPSADRDGLPPARTRAQLAPTSSSTLPPRSTWATASLMADKG